MVIQVTMKKIDKIIFDRLSRKEQIKLVLQPKGGQEYKEKRELIQKIKEAFGEGCIERDYTKYSFRAPNLIILNKGDIKLILYFHYSEEIGFYGFDKNIITEIIDWVNKNNPEKVFFNLLFMLGIPDEETVYFCIPIFFIKNIESDISVTKDKGTIGPGYRINLELIKNRYYLKLKKGRYEDISDFKIEISELFNQTLITRYNEEKIRYENIVRDKQELLKKFSRDQLFRI